MNTLPVYYIRGSPACLSLRSIELRFTFSFEHNVSVTLSGEEGILATTVRTWPVAYSRDEESIPAQQQAAEGPRVPLSICHRQLHHHVLCARRWCRGGYGLHKATVLRAPSFSPSRSFSSVAAPRSRCCHFHRHHRLQSPRASVSRWQKRSKPRLPVPNARPSRSGERLTATSSTVATAASLSGSGASSPPT